MKLLNLCMVLIVSFATRAFAGREDFNQIPESVRTALSNAATSLGYDLSTETGRKSFGDYLKSQKDSLATSQGFDMKTEEGRQAMRDYVKSQADAIATAQGFDTTTKEGRDALQAYLIAQGDYALIAPPGHPHDRGGRDGQAAAPAPRDGEQRAQGGAPPCARDQFNNAGSSNSASNGSSTSANGSASSSSNATLAKSQVQVGGPRADGNNGGRPH